MTKTLFVLQGGGPTAVINATLAGVAKGAIGTFDRLIGVRHSFEPVDGERLIDLSPLLDRTNKAQLETLTNTTGAFLHSSRKKVDEQDLTILLALMNQENAHDIIGIGGNGTMHALQQLSDYASANGYVLRVSGAPKTVDNDIPGVEIAPGYGSAARFVALATRDFDCDFRAMSTFDDVTILETMGRNTGWLAAASTFLMQEQDDAPHMVLLPERPFDVKEFLNQVSINHKTYGRVFIVTNEMLSDTDGNIVGESFQDGPKDTLGRSMFSLSLGTGNYLANRIWKSLGLQSRCLRPGSLGRAMTSCISSYDRELAWNIGVASVDILNANENLPQMIAVDKRGKFGKQLLTAGTGQRPLPSQFLDTDQPFGISRKFAEEYVHVIGKVTPILTEFKSDR